jgi:hypothetical protein
MSTPAVDSLWSERLHWGFKKTWLIEAHMMLLVEKYGLAGAE